MNVLEQLQGMREQGGASLEVIKSDLAKFESAVKQVDDVLIFLRTAKDDLECIGLEADVTFDAGARVSVSFVLPVVQSLAQQTPKPNQAAAIGTATLPTTSAVAEDDLPTAPPFARHKSAEPIKKPRGGAKAMKAGPRVYKVGPFSDEEMQCIAQAMDAGKSRDEIVELVNRSKISVGMKIKAIKAERAKKPRPVAAEPAPVKLEAKAIPKPAPKPEPSLDLPKLSADDRAVVTHLDALGYSGGWSAEKDFEILTGLTTGKAAALVADEMGVEVGDVVSRFRALNTKVGDIGHQSRLLRILRQRAGA